MLFRPISQIPPGSIGPPTGWGLKTVTLNGADITDVPLDIATLTDVSGIEVTLTDTITVLSGNVTNARRENLRDYVVVILPDGLRPGARPERFTRVGRPNQEGRYQIRGLPAGDYLAGVVATLEECNEWNPALAHGQTTTLDLELME